MNTNLPTPPPHSPPPPPPSDGSPVFFDPTRRRGARFQRVAVALATFALTALVVFAISVLAVPVAQRVSVLPTHFMPDTALRNVESLDRKPKANTVNPANPAKGIVAPPQGGRGQGTPSTAAANAQGGAIAGKGAGVVGGFYVSWDSASLASLKQHGAEMTHFFPGWLHLNENGGQLVVKDSDPSDLEALQVARQDHLMIVPLLNNFSDGLQDFDGDRLHALLIDPAKRAKVIAQIRDYLTRHRYGGINIDLESDNDDDRALLPQFAMEMSHALHPLSLLVTEDTQAGNAEQAAAIARWCDFIIPMIYDLHYAEGGMPGPIAPDDWARDELNSFLDVVPASKTVLAIGNYAYNWIENKPNAQSLTFGEAMATASESQDGDDGVVRYDPKSRNPYFSYTEDDGKRHVVWFLDAVTAYNLQKYAATRGVQGRALWYVGSADPTLWSFFGKGKNTDTKPDLTSVRYGFEIDFEGEGEILDIAAHPQDGHREVTWGPDGYIDNETFTSYPTAYIVRRTGQHRDRSGHLQKQLALTFDDGPDPRWTPEILDALAREHIPATFFVVGVNAQSRPDLLQREWDAGDEIGNHTFYHPNAAQISDRRINLEIDATQRTIQSAILRSTTLFRPPFGIDVQPTTSDELRPIDIAQSKGYVTVAEGIDPRDWEGGEHKHTAQEIADSIVGGAHNGEGNVVLLHDAGGDREQTVLAIPLAVNRLKAEGYTFVTVTDLLGTKGRDAYFPPVTGRQRDLILLDRQVFGFSSWGGRALVALFLFTLFAGSFRLLGVGTLAIAHARRERLRDDFRSPRAIASPQNDVEAFSVSVIIAAYNEEKVVARTVRALLDGGYPHLEVLVVDDGSRDGTSAVVAETLADEPRVRLITKENGGKASALNLGIAQATGEILIGLDADTLFAPDTVHRLCRHFADPRVGAVAGNVRVGNRRNLLTRWQSVEYTTSQNFDRRAYEMLNAIPVIPGAVSAWRAEAVRDAGGYSTDTLAEDADLTWRVRRLGWRLQTDSTALAYTEAPERLRELLKQRFRWTFGTLQTLWKHRDLLFRWDEGALGLIVAPSLWLFQILLPLALPFADLGLIFAAVLGNLHNALFYFVFFFVIELWAAILAFALDPKPRAPWTDLGYLFFQRMAYRYLLFFVLIRALMTAVYGSRAGWNKLERRGTAQVSTGS